jgi:hypothetical protein
MGTWGSGNFDNDTAADHLGELIDELIEDVTKTMARGPGSIEPDEYGGVAVPCNLEILCLLAKQKWVGVELPEAATIAKWKATYLGVWDAKIDGLKPKPSHKTARRAVLVATFDELEALARANDDDDDDDDEPTAAKVKPVPKAKPKAKKPAKARKPAKAAVKPKSKNTAIARARRT